MSRRQLKAALDLVRRLPPARQTKTLAAILRLVPRDDFAEELLADVDQPLKQKTCPTTGKPFIICEFNRDADSFRSPWSNLYVPELADGITPSEPLRALEKELNFIFAMYTKQYFGEEGLSSVYLWDTGEEGSWCCAVMIRKDVKGVGTWNSMHVITVQEYPGDSLACYQMTTSIMLRMAEKEKAASGKYTFKLAGNIAKQWKQYDATFGDPKNHVENIGNYVQHYENKIRGNLPDIYFGKTMQVTSEVRSLRPEAEQVHMITMLAKPKKKKVWRQYADENGDAYWYNTVSGVSQWEPPENPKETFRTAKSAAPQGEGQQQQSSDLDKQKAAHPAMGALALAAQAAAQKQQKSADSAKEGSAAAAGASPQGSPAAAARDVSSPPPAEAGEPAKKKKGAWKKAVHEGRDYWYNRATGDTSWDPPPEEAESASPAPAATSAAAPAAAATSPSVAAAAPTGPGSRPGPTASVEDVCAWIRTLGLASDYSQAVRENAIDGEVLPTMSEADLQEAMGITAFGDKRKIGKAMGWR
ncbi:F-actin-capping protein subunit beta [Diplonema papillatum]|nr:F-actin-capping protein subunit beta [Diplonema papillatum]